MYWIKQYFTRPREHWNALQEVLITLVGAIIPFLVAFVFNSAKLPDQFVSFWGMFDRGQMYILAYGMCGPIIWLAFVKADVPRHGVRVLLGLVSLVPMFVIVALIAPDGTTNSIENRSIVLWSYFLYPALLVVNYLLIFFCKIQPPSADESLGKSSAEMKNRYQKEFGE